jgi:hypothetical protein
MLFKPGCFPTNLIFKEETQMDEYQLVDINEIIKKGINKFSMVRKLCTIKRFGSGEVAKVNVPRGVPKRTRRVWVLPGLGYQAQNFIEGIGEEVYVPTFSITALASWKEKYNYTDVVERAALQVARDLSSYEDDCFFNIVVRSATLDDPNNHLNICKISHGHPGSKYMSEELLLEMFKKFRINRRTLTDVCVGRTDAKDLQQLKNAVIENDKVVAIDLTFKNKIYRVNVHEVYHLGAKGKYNINERFSEYGEYKASEDNTFQDYTIMNPNQVNANGVATTLGETQIYGFDPSIKKTMIMCIRKEYEAFDDPTLQKVQKFGFLGWGEVGFAFLENTKICMGVIDRSE